MEQVKLLPLLIICVQTATGFIWNSSTTSISVCVGNTISLDWVYTLESGEFLQGTSWTKSDGAGVSVSLANDLVGFTPAPAYVGRLTHIEKAWIEISNATSSDIGTYNVVVSLISGLVYRMTATVHVHEIANASCIPTCDISWKCQIPQACPVQNYIDAVWTVDGVKYTNVFQCSPNNYNKPYNVCAEGDAVTSCYRGSPLCREENKCIAATTTITTTVKETSETASTSSIINTSTINTSTINTSINNTSTAKQGENDSHQHVIIISVSVSVGVIGLVTVIIICCCLHHRRKRNKDKTKHKAYHHAIARNESKSTNEQNELHNVTNTSQADSCVKM